MKTPLAFIIGNGTSRKEFDLNKLNNKGVVFGCNALFREYTPNYIVAIDDKAIDIVNNSKFPSHKIIIPPDRERYELSGTGKRSNAGMNAMYEAIKRGHNELYCLGFDFIIKDKEQSLSNVFDNTEGYGSETRATMQDNLGRIDYLKWFAKKFFKVNFYFVLPKKELEIHDVSAINVKGLFYDKFNDILERME